MRIAELEKQKQDLEQKIALIRSGVVEEFDSTRIKERWFEAEDTARKLLSDFRQVEYNFRALDREVREMITLSDKAKGELLDEIFNQQNYIHDSEQGKSFSAFWGFLMSARRQEELEQLTETALQQDALQQIEDVNFLRYIGHALLDAGQKVYQTNAQLVEQLRKYLADQAWLENKRILQIIRDIEKSTLVFNCEHRGRLPRDYFFIQQAKVETHLLMEHQLFMPGQSNRISSTTIEELDIEVDISALYQQHWVDEAGLKQNIRRMLQTRQQVSLSELLKAYPLQQGLAELVSYLNIACKRRHTVIDETTMAQMELESVGDLRVSHDLLLVRHRLAQIPEIIFMRSNHDKDDE